MVLRQDYEMYGIHLSFQFINFSREETPSYFKQDRYHKQLSPAVYYNDLKQRNRNKIHRVDYGRIIKVTTSVISGALRLTVEWISSWAKVIHISDK